MNDKVREFLTEKKVAEQKRYEKEKQKVLIELGLFEKVYSPDNSRNDEFSIGEWDATISKTRYYKIVPIGITDEEYAEVKKYSKRPNTYEKPLISTALAVIAWIILIGGLIAGISLGITIDRGYYSTDIEFSLVTAITYWFPSLVSGTLLLGFAEAINLLNSINMK